jgi:hypothetical protein
MKSYATVSRISQRVISATMLRISWTTISQILSVILPEGLQAIYATVSRKLILEDN